MVSLDRFELFCAVVEAGSFTAAATRLCQTRAAVSFGIKQLEAQLGVTLLIRNALQLFQHHCIFSGLAVFHH